MSDTAKSKALDILSVFGRDAKKSNEGTWVQKGPGRFLIGRLGSSRNKLLAATKLRDLGEDREKFDTAMDEVIADSILLNWENVTYGGEPLPYSKENVFKVLRDPNLEPFREWLSEQATSALNFEVEQRKQEETTLKNS